MGAGTFDEFWDWDLIPAGTAIPEDLWVAVEGTRRPVLFVEGEPGGTDHQVYAALFRDRNVIPRRGCDQVVAAVRAFRALDGLHRVDAVGVIDRDRRTDAEVAACRADGVLVTDVAEVENLLLVEDVLGAVAAALRLPAAQADAAVGRAKAVVLRELERTAADQTAQRAVAQVRAVLGRFGPRQVASGDDLAERLQAHVQGVDAARVWAESGELYRRIVRDQDYPAALRNANGPGLPRQIAPCFDLTAAGYQALAVRLLSAPDGAARRSALRRYLPDVPAAGRGPS